jgi:hypothetical protein
MTSMPAFSIPRSVSASDDRGPMVAMIFVFLGITLSCSSSEDSELCAEAVSSVLMR